MFKELNPLLHSELRLAVMSLLICLYPATDGGNGGQPQRAD